MQEKKRTALVWIRRDLRLKDHRALSEATINADEVHLLFNFDPLILETLPPNDRRISFIIESLKEMEEQLNKKGSTIWIGHGDPIDEIPKWVKKLNITDLYFNHDYEPYAKKRDSQVQAAVKCEVHHFKDSVIFEGGEILTNKGETYKVFTPYKNSWYERLSQQERELPLYKVKTKSFAQIDSNPHSILNKDWFKKLGFEPTDNILKGGTSAASKRLKKFSEDIMDYEEARDYPSLEKTSNISPYIRHGNISIRDLFRQAFSGTSSGHKVWASELIWREFYQTILDQFPHVDGEAYRPEYEKIKWQGGKKEWEAWKNGQTGFPLIDASMRCLNETGMMHNRLRMVVASFLCKTLLLDWKKGEAYFALKLLDFDLAANNGGWQWSASTGTDAQPYFRIFNPYSQSEKFDKDGAFIKKWCPELSGFSKKLIHNPAKADMIEQSEAGCTIGVDYPYPVVDYKTKRALALEMYKKAKN